MYTYIHIHMDTYGHICKYIYIHIGAHGVMVIGVGNGHDDTSSYPGQDWLRFT